jgi:DNA adenine methylase
VQYLGGKYRIRKWLAAEIAPYRTPGRILWEPFCGGLNASEALLPDICSDIDTSLIALYQAVRAGWEPPAHVDEKLYAYAHTLPESNPLHGFCAFGCSFGGKKWGGFARGVNGNYAAIAKRAVLRAVSALSLSCFEVLDFNRIDPYPIDADIYCDPPYRNTTGYRSGTFDSDAFVLRVKQWARHTNVFVSEYDWPDQDGLLLAEHTAKQTAGNKSIKPERTERLFLVLP